MPMPAKVETGMPGMPSTRRTLPLPPIDLSVPAVTWAIARAGYSSSRSRRTGIDRHLGGRPAGCRRGLLSGLQRKTCEPIAVEAGVHRKPVQNFVGAGGWDDEAVMAELRGHVREELADPQAVLILDPSGFPKSGTESCGVARQWCGRLGKQDNCQLGVFLAYAAPGGYAPLDRRLYLPEDWAADPVRREQVPRPRGRDLPGVVADRRRPAASGAARTCPTPGSAATTSWADRRSSAAGSGGTASGTCSTCPATRTSATWSAAAPRGGVPAGAASGRCRSAAPTPGRRGSRTRGGPG